MHRLGTRPLAGLGLALILGFSMLVAACGSGSKASSPPPAKAAYSSPSSRPLPATTPPTTAAQTPVTTPVGTLSPTTLPPPTTAVTTRQVLPPATVPPKVDECTQQLTFGADGSVGPVSCANGDLNLLAWQEIAKGNPLVMTLGPYATPGQVEEALCSDLSNSTIPIASSAYQIAALYYGWSFAVDPSQILLDGGCPTTDPAPVPVPATPAQTDPWAVVSEYYGDVSSRDYADAWNLFAPTMQDDQGSYSQWVAGYADTGAQDVTEISESGDQVNYDLQSDNPDGTTQWYSGVAIVVGGQIQSARLTQVAGNPDA
jgi:hypothetical protein